MRLRDRLRTRGVVLAALAVAAILAALELRLSLTDLLPARNQLDVAARFLRAALSPALQHEAQFVPENAPPILVKALSGAHQTVVLAAAAISLSLALGVALGFFASSSCWRGDPAGSASRTRQLVARAVAPMVYGTTRIVIAAMRSVHELLWAVLLLCALGRSGTSAVLAIAIPYSGTLAKIFSEMIDEAPRDAAHALRSAGARPLQVFLFGLVPRALPDMAAYSFYRFECALRSSAIMGFFGYPTLGRSIRLSYENTHYREVWTYLYTLFALILVVEWWSGALRRRFAA